MTDRAHPQCFIHPLTGRWTEATEAALAAADREARAEIDRIYKALRPVTVALAALRGGELPPARHRTSVQKAFAAGFDQGVASARGDAA